MAAAAALTPRVRILVVCDEAIPSETEEGVYTLEGVRQRVVAPTFPCQRDFDLFLVVSCPRQGKYDGSVHVVNDETLRVVRWVPFSVTFDEANNLVPFSVEVPNCRLPNAGDYTVEVWLTTPDGDAAQKGELPLIVVAEEE